MLLFLLSITISESLYLKSDLFINTKFNNNNIYISTEGGGFLSFGTESGEWKVTTRVSGLFSNTPSDFLVHNDSILVLMPGGISIFNEELQYLNSLAFNPLFFSDTNPNTIEIYNGSVVLGGTNGLEWFDLSDFDNLSRVDHEDYNFEVFEILSLDSCCIMGTSEGIYKTYNLSDTLRMKDLSPTYSIIDIGSSLWAGGGWGCRDITADTAQFSLYTVRQIDEIDGSVYLSTPGGLYKYNGGWVNIYPGNVRGVFRINYFDTLLIAERGEGLLILDSTSYIRPPGPVSNMICDITQISNGNIYMSHRNNRSISMYNNGLWKAYNKNNEFGFPGGIIFNIESDSKDRIYIGLWYWNQVSILYEWIPEDDSIPFPINLPVSATTITGMFVDKSDNLWVGALSGGNDWILKMSRFEEDEDSLEWTVFTSPSFRWIRVFAEGDDAIYAGNSPTVGGAGIHLIYQDNTIEEVTGNLGSSTLSLTSDISGDIWAGLENSLVHISGNNVVESFTSGNSGLISDKVDDVIVDFQGGLWCYHSGDGLSYRSPGGDWDNFTGFAYIGGSDITHPLYFTKEHHLLVGTYDGLYDIDIDFNIPGDSLDYAGTNVYPNPFNVNEHEYLYFSSKQLEGKRIYIYDIRGKLKRQYTVAQEDFIRINNIDFPSGLYFFVVKGDGGVVDKGKFVVIR